MVVVFNSSATSNAVTVGLYRSLGSLEVTSVSGCQSQDATGRGAQGCLTNDLLTIRGANFNATGMAVEMYELDAQLLYLCQLPTVINSSTMTCRLPYIASLQTQIITLPIRVTLGRAMSNWLLGVGYSGSLNSSPSTASDGNRSVRHSLSAWSCWWR